MYLNMEKKSIVASEIQLKQLKNIELNILKIFEMICEKENIEYFMAGGTLLGAVRHKGFIPWDDDIDIVMKRAEYNSFLKVCDKYLPDYMKLVNPETDPHYGLTFSKLMDTRSEFGEIFTKDIPVEKGVFIDIFPLDNAPDSRMKRSIHKIKRYYWKKMLLLKCKYNFGKKGVKGLIYKLLELYANLFTKKYIIKKYETNAQKYNLKSTKQVVNLSGVYEYDRECLNREWLEETIKISFEGMRLKAPKGYEGVLASLFGDYMKLPPKEEQINKHELASLVLYYEE